MTGGSYDVTDHAPYTSQSPISDPGEMAGWLAGLPRVLARCPIPNARELQKQAKLFLEAADKQAVTHEIAAMRDENDELKSQIAELKRMFVEMANKEESSTPAASEKPRRTQKSAEVAA